MMNGPVSDSIARFSPIPLREIEAVKLMARADTKYQCNINRLPRLLELAACSHHMLETGGQRIQEYESLYLDTPDFGMYLDHHNGKLNRYKVRIRKYLGTGARFLEIKKKDNKGQTHKERIPLDPGRDHRTPFARHFVEIRSPYRSGQLMPVLKSSFQRITLVSNEMIERITIDLSPSWNNGRITCSLPGLVIIEVKSAGTPSRQGFNRLLREERIFSGRFSKYCTGISLLYPELKTNRFKERLLFLRKLDNPVSHESSVSL